MKNIILAVVTSLALVSVARAEQVVADNTAGASSIPVSEEFQLTTLNINPQSYILGNRTIVGGKVEINYSTKEVTALFYPKQPVCPKGVMCPMYMLGPIVVTLPITYLGSGFCGGTVITAEKNLLMVDGGRTTISLFDEKENVCTGKPNPEAALHMTLTEESRQGLKIDSSFLGN